MSVEGSAVPAHGDTVVPGVLLSTNAVDWVSGPIEVRRGRGFRAAGSSEEALWISGDQGAIVRAGLAQAPAVGLQRTGDAWRFVLSGANRIDTILETSVDCQTWQPAGLVVNPAKQVDFPIAPPSAADRQFYRASLR